MTGGYNRDNLTWNDQFINGQFNRANPTYQPFPPNYKSYGDIGFGTLLNNTNEGSLYWYTGFAVYHANQPNVAFGDLVQKKCGEPE